MTENEVRQVFLGINDSVQGIRLTPLDRPADAPVREAFYSTVMKKSAAQMRAHWARKVFTGTGDVPKTVNGPVELGLLLAADGKNYVAYVDASEVTSDMQVLFRK